MKPVWRSAALADLRRLHRFLAPKNPRAARHAIEAIRAGVKILESFPNIGRLFPNSTPNTANGRSILAPAPTSFDTASRRRKSRYSPYAMGEKTMRNQGSGAL